MTEAIKIILHYGDKEAMETLNIPKFGPFFYIQDELDEANAIVKIAAEEFAYDKPEHIELMTDSEALLLTVQRAVRKGYIKKENVTMWYHSSQGIKEMRIDEEGTMLDDFAVCDRYEWRFPLIFT